MKSSKEKNKQIPTEKGVNVVKRNKDGVIADPQGSYTGIPVDKNDKPVQDADDL